LEHFSKNKKLLDMLGWIEGKFRIPKIPVIH